MFFLFFAELIHQGNVTVSEVWNDKLARYYHVMISCKLPAHINTSANRIVLCDHNCTIVASSDEVVPSNFHNRTAGIGVCTKVLYGSPDPIRLVEWIEMNRLLGATSIYLYNGSVNGPANNILKYYNKSGLVKIRQHDFVNKMARVISNGKFPVPSYQQTWVLEEMSMNDCLYTSSEQIIANFDIDELITPLKHGSLKTLSEYLMTNQQNAASYRFNTAVFSDDIPIKPRRFPNFLHMINHNQRTRIDPESPKSMIRPSRCLSMSHHVCWQALPGISRVQGVPDDVGYLRHYRVECRLVGEPKKCKKLMKQPITDNFLEKYAAELTARIEFVRNASNLTTIR